MPPSLPGDQDRERLDALVSNLYRELHSLAKRALAREGGPLTLSTTALLHEAYVKLWRHPEPSKLDRAYLFAAASRAMRQVLVEHARRRGRIKRGGGTRPVRIEEADVHVQGPSADVLVIDALLSRLAAIHPRAAQVVEGRFFAGLSLDEVAEALDVSSRTAKRDWSFAKAWLHGELKGGPEQDGAVGSSVP